MLKLFYFINGLYDIFCGLTILKIIHIPYLQNLHLNMLQETNNEAYERFFAYWVITYGIMRLSNQQKLIAISYVTEGLVLLNEFKHNNIVIENSFLVIASSFMLANSVLCSTESSKN